MAQPLVGYEMENMPTFYFQKVEMIIWIKRKHSTEINKRRGFRKK